jgi:hypothetical protein
MTLQTKLDAFTADFEGGKPPYNVPHSINEAMHRPRSLHEGSRVEQSCKPRVLAEPRGVESVPLTDLQHSATKKPVLQGELEWRRFSIALRLAT